MYQAQRYFHTLELDKVLAKLADQANCDDSKRMALSLTPSTERGHRRGKCDGIVCG